MLSDGSRCRLDDLTKSTRSGAAQPNAANVYSAGRTNFIQRRARKKVMIKKMQQLSN
jgi:hypothetical protein